MLSKDEVDAFGREKWQPEGPKLVNGGDGPDATWEVAAISEGGTRVALRECAAGADSSSLRSSE